MSERTKGCLTGCIAVAGIGLLFALGIWWSYSNFKECLEVFSWRHCLNLE